MSPIFLFFPKKKKKTLAKDATKAELNVLNTLVKLFGTLALT